MSYAKTEALRLARAQLWAMPVINPDRPKLSDRVPYPPDKLFAKCRKFLTLGAVYAQRETFARQMADPPANVYPGWCKPTTQSKPQPFETPGCLPGMESFYEQVHS